jgi:hypothetical protein
MVSSLDLKLSLDGVALGDENWDTPIKEIEGVKFNWKCLKLGKIQAELRD